METSAKEQSGSWGERVENLCLRPTVPGTIHKSEDRLGRVLSSELLPVSVGGQRHSL